MLVLGSDLSNVTAWQKQFATSTSSRPSMYLQHGELSGFNNLLTGKAGLPITFAHTIFIVTSFFGHSSGTVGGVRSPGIGCRNPSIGGRVPGNGGGLYPGNENSGGGGKARENGGGLNTGNGNGNSGVGGNSGV